MTTSAILLAGGTGRRFKSSTPKQYLQLANKPIACHSFDLFLSIPEITEVIVVCDKEWRHLFDGATAFADPGERRQDSLYNGLQKVSKHSRYICSHDAARPLISSTCIKKILSEAASYGAATAATPIPFTIKEADAGQFVIHTPNRDLFWEIQTPQIIRRDWLEAGFQIAREKNLTVTDDTALVELLSNPVKLVETSSPNPKITTPMDLIVAEQLCVTE